MVHSYTRHVLWPVVCAAAQVLGRMEAAGLHVDMAKLAQVARPLEDSLTAVRPATLTTFTLHGRMHTAGRWPSHPAQVDKSCGHGACSHSPHCACVQAREFLLSHPVMQHNGFCSGAYISICTLTQPRRGITMWNSRQQCQF